MKFISLIVVFQFLLLLPLNHCQLQKLYAIITLYSYKKLKPCLPQTKSEANT